jgi:hypothetical protein
VAARHHREREDHCPVDAGNLPSWWYKIACEDEYHREQEETDDEREPEPAQDPRHFNEEIGPFHLLLCRTPRDVVRKKMRKEGL